MKFANIAWLVIVGTVALGCEKEGSTSVPECDEYFKKAEECFAKNPVVKEQMGDSIKQLKEVLKARASMPGEKEKMVAECKQHITLLSQTCK